jgi:NADH-quinone oxidoreductase subunit M
VIALAVPLSTNFAGEFLILTGAFFQAWGWAVAGAVSIVLAAMYMLRLVSGVLHRDVGGAVGPEDRDLRPAELAIVVPLVACLLALSAWPAAISDRSFAGDAANTQLAGNFRAAEPVEPKRITIIVARVKP